MARKSIQDLPEWSRKILAFRQTLRLTQGELGERLKTSAMAISRWERGDAKPPADAYIRLGNIADDPLCWFLWGQAGLSTADVMRVLPTASRRLRQGRIPTVQGVHAGVEGSLKPGRFVAIPILPVRAATAGAEGDEVSDLDQLKPEAIWTAPMEWCPNPASTISLRVPALFLRNLLTPLLGNGNAYHTVWLAVVFSAWYCGLGPSILSTLLGAAGIWYFFLPPFHSFAIQDRTETFGMLGFLTFSSAIIALGESNRRGLAARLKSEERFRAIVETTPECVKVVASDGTLLHMNSSGLRMVGADSAETVIGNSVYDLIESKDRDRFRAFNEKVCRGEKGSLEFDIVGLRGVRRHVETHAAPLQNPDGTVVQLAVTRDITSHKQAEEAIKERELSARLLQLQDEDRRRIARELHDGVGQLLAAMGMNASRLDREKANLSPDAARCAEENSKLIGQVSADIRTISYLFHPPLLDEMGLDSALKWYVEGFAERSKITAKLELPTVGERLPHDYELCLFRIAQECLTNIHRHSGSSTALVRLLRSPVEIKLEVSDEGKGLNQETQSRIASGETGGVGLRGMRERVRQLGGSLEIRSNGHGSTVIATVPFVKI